MAARTVLLEKRADGTRVVTLRGLEDLALVLDKIDMDADSRCVVVTAEGRFWSNGLDLAWVDSVSPEEGDRFTQELNSLMCRILCFPLPTVAALNGHWCAAGGMLGLCFDYRVMNSDRGYFFVPAVDLGVVYSAFQIELMKCKLPFWMHREVICFNSTRWRAKELVEHRVCDLAVPAESVLSASLEVAETLKSKGAGPARGALGEIKRRVFAQVVGALDEDAGLMKFGGRSAGINYAPPPPRL